MMCDCGGGGRGVVRGYAWAARDRWSKKLLLQAVLSINRLALRACFSLNVWPVAEPEGPQGLRWGWTLSLAKPFAKRKEACGELGHFGTPVQHEGWPGSPEGFVHRVRETRVHLTDFFSGLKR